MNGKDLHSLQEAYLEVHQLNEKEDSEYEKASDAALDSRYGYGRAQGDKRSFGRAANRASAAAMLRRLRKDRDEGRETSRESGADAVHQGWSHTARTSEDQTPEKKEKRKKLADTEYKDLPDDEKEKDRVSADAVRAVYNRKKKKDTNEEMEPIDTYNFVLEYLLDEGFASTTENADKIILNMSESWFEDIMEARRSEKEGMGSPERRLDDGRLISGQRSEKKRKGEMGGRHFWSGGEGGSNMERGKKKVKGAKGDENKYTQHGRNEVFQDRKETSGKYSEMQRKRRGGGIGSRFD